MFFPSLPPATACYLALPLPVHQPLSQLLLLRPGMRDAEPPRHRRRLALSLLLLLATLAVGAAAQRQQQALPVPPELRSVNEQLTALTNNVADTISDRFSFCVSDTREDWNGAFNYTSDLRFVERCLAETRGDMPQRLCTPAEAKFYFTSLYDPKGEKNLFLETNINCGITSWSPGCEPGWGCSLGLNAPPTNNETIPVRATNCQACCEGFFCPRGLTCMLPCPLGSYCPRAKGNETTGLCDPYKYQITPNSTNGCGGADKWADFGSTEEIFCPAGYHCPSTMSKLSCSSGHFCKLGSTTEKKCIIKGSCKENEENENIIILGACLVGLIGVLLLVVYNCSGQFLTIRERRKARSRENAIQLARQQLKAHQGWKAAKQLARRHVTGVQDHLSRTFSRRRSFRHQPADLENSSHRVQEARLMGSVKDNEMSDSMVFAAQNTSEISEVMPSIIMDISGDGEVVATKDKPAPKGKHRSTHTQIFKYAYGEIELEKARQEENKNMSFTGVVAKVKEQQKEMTRPLLKVEFKNLTLSLGKRKLLRSVTGELQPGRVTAVMGPSGAGKTTFLNAVAGKVTGYQVTGSVLVNGAHGSIRSYKKIIGFVPQDDVVHGNLTVEENLWFSANCRLPARMSHRDRVLIVERVIESLDLQGVRNSVVGTVEKRGISGGQRKRVNVGIEMVMEPSLLILDEPTSGLDSSSSQLLLKALRHEAREGVNICAVVHQPSYTLYNMFDDLILLAKGGLIVYNGPIKTIEDYFSTLGIHVPDRVNPPDHYIDILEGIVKPESGINAKHLPVHWMLYNGYEVPSDMKDDLKAMGEQTPDIDINRSMSGSTPHCLPGVSNVFAEERNRLEHRLSKPSDLSSRRTPGILKQYKFFLGRVTKQRLREGRLLGVDFLILGLAGICLGTIAKLSDPTFGMPGYIYTIIAVSLLCKIAALRSFSLERLQYLRERESGMSSLAYFLARDTIDHFSTVLKPIIYLSMFYFFNNPRSSIGDNYIVLLALVYCVTGIGYTFAICFNPGSAQLCSALIPVVLTLLSTQRTTPTFLKNISYPKWALEGFIIVNAKQYPGVWLITRCGLLFRSGFDIHNYKLCILVLFMYGLFFRIVAFVAMILLKKR